MRLVALVESPDHVCCRYRLAAFRPALEAAGHSLELRPFPKDWAGRLRVGRDLGHADAVILQRRLPPTWLTRRLRRHARQLVFDFDDAVWLRDSYHPRGLHSRRRLGRFRAVVEAADSLVGGNAYLLEHAARWTSADNLTLVPTCVDVGRYPLAAHAGPAQLVWVGSSSTLRGLEAARPLLDEVGRRNPGVSLKLICDRFLSFESLPVTPCAWSAEGEAAEIAACDVGISWVPDDPWSRGKCGLKVVQYMAAGLPVVTNPVGVHAELVAHGETGFLAETPAEWADAVARLAADPDLRRRMGAAGRRRAESHYSVAAGASRWLQLLDRWKGERRCA